MNSCCSQGRSKYHPVTQHHLPGRVSQFQLAPSLLLICMQCHFFFKHKILSNNKKQGGRSVYSTRSSVGVCQPPTTRKPLLRSHHPGVTFSSVRTTSQIDLPLWSSPLRIVRYPHRKWTETKCNSRWLYRVGGDGLMGSQRMKTLIYCCVHEASVLRATGSH